MTVDLVADYVTSLLSYPAEQVLIGRENFNKPDSEVDYVVVDELTSTPISSVYNYDGVAEQEKITTIIRLEVTLDFYGNNAQANALKLQSLQKSQQSYELQRDLGFQVCHVSAMTNLKQVEGLQYSNRYQLALRVVGHDTQIVNTLRIDEAVTTFINDK